MVKLPPDQVEFESHSPSGTEEDTNPSNTIVVPLTLSETTTQDVKRCFLTMLNE